MDFKAISSVVAEDFEAVNRFITHHLDTEVPVTIHLAKSFQIN